MASKVTQPKAPETARHHLRVAAVQMKFAPTIAENLLKIEHLLGEAARRRADAVLLPECATTGYAYDFSRLTTAEVRTALNAVGAMAARRSPISNAIEARKMSLENWCRRKHRWGVPMGESLANFSLGTESQRWHIILPWKSVIA